MIKRVIADISFLRCPFWEIKIRNGISKAELRTQNLQLIASIEFDNGYWILFFSLFGNKTPHSASFQNMEDAMKIAPIFIFEQINQVFKIYDVK